MWGDVGRCGEMWGDVGRCRARLAQALDDVVCTERELHVQVAVEVGVVADDDLGAGGQRLLPGDEPVGDLARLLHEVAARRLVGVRVRVRVRVRAGFGFGFGLGLGLGLGFGFGFGSGLGLGLGLGFGVGLG